MEVRVALPTDAGRLEPLFRVLGYPASGQQLAIRPDRLRNDVTYIAWVACVSGQVVGFAAGHLIYPIEDDAPAAQLIALVTDPRHSDRGVGTGLCQQFEAWSQSQGAPSELWSTLGNERTGAHRFYERQGYEATGLRFRKSLAPSR